MSLPFFDVFAFFRGWREEADQEFVALSAMLLCGELELRQDTFQAITTKPEVGKQVVVMVVIRGGNHRTSVGLAMSSFYRAAQILVPIISGFCG